MKKFQQWRENQVYFMHLSNLNLIRSRKLPGTVSIKKRRTKQNRSLSQQQLDKSNQRMIKRIQNPKRIAIISNSDYFKPAFSKEKKRLYEKNLNYQNLLFGKRLLQASSVISTSKYEKDYDSKHNHRMTRQNNTSWSLRSTKLKQFQKSQQPSIYLKGYGRHILKIKIHDYDFYKLKLQDDDMHSISIIIQFGRSIRQSDIINLKQFINHQFCFKFSKKPGYDGSVRAYIRYHNGIQDIQLGYFNFSIQYYLQGQSSSQKQEQQIFKRTGAYCGRIVFSTSAVKTIQYF